ncbi:MAG: hypothetical protein K8J08_12225 [Thermoanaerobaculia bacterium]|nr:hypothetical protein [Thermoanaerobaculia bacterium]
MLDSNFREEIEDISERENVFDGNVRQSPVLRAGLMRKYNDDVVGAESKEAADSLSFNTVGKLSSLRSGQDTRKVTECE